MPPCTSTSGSPGRRSADRCDVRAHHGHHLLDPRLLQTGRGAPRTFRDTKIGTVLVGALLMLLVVGSGVAWRGWDAISGAVERAAGKQRICSTLGAGQRMGLVRVETPTRCRTSRGRWIPTPVAGPPRTTRPCRPSRRRCPPRLTGGQARWRSYLPSSTPGGVGCCEQPVRLRRRQQPVAVWRAMFAMGGAPAGARRSVAPTVVGATPAMLAQNCAAGTYSAVMVAAPGLQLDRSLARKTVRALRQVERRLD